MVRKTLGYVQLEWTCPQCGTRNRGTDKSCANCGAAQPARVAFHQAAQDNLITDEDEIARAEAGPDIHCAYCGARNPATAQKCSQCGADLTTATARESGQVVGAFSARPAPQVKCPQCGTPNDANALKCSQCNASLPRSRRTSPPKDAAPRDRASHDHPPAAPKPFGKIGRIGIVGLVVAALLVCVVGLVIIRSINPAREITAQVEDLSWTRSIQVLGPRKVTQETWRDEIPPGATLGRCTQKRHHTQDEPAPRATEVCGTPYVIDTGTGHGQVVQDCQYVVYAEWCQYEAQEWTEVDVITLSGDNPLPRWPEPALNAQQRQGELKESYEITFANGGKTYAYRTTDPDLFAQFQVGSQWVLRVGGLGMVKPVRPAP
jgi:DNA-directed RNA polymerase subunit RPC12/RpoP